MLQAQRPNAQYHGVHGMACRRHDGRTRDGMRCSNQSINVWRAVAARVGRGGNMRLCCAWASTEGALMRPTLTTTSASHRRGPICPRRCVGGAPQLATHSSPLHRFCSVHMHMPSLRSLLPLSGGTRLHLDAQRRVLQMSSQRLAFSVSARLPSARRRAAV